MWLEVIDAIAFLIFFIILIVTSLIDVKTKEVPDSLSFGLLAFALAYRIFQSFFIPSIMIIVALNFLLFFILSCIFYYGRMFGGGDFKLLSGLAVALAYPPLLNVKEFFPIKFLFYCLIVSGVYGIFWAAYITLKNKKKFDFRKEIGQKKFFLILVLSLFLFLLSFLFFLLKQNPFFLFSSLIFIVFPFLYIIINFADKMLIIEKKPSQLIEGDLLYEDVKVGKVVIKSRWDGLSKKEIKILKRARKNVKIKEGIPFVPVFLISFILVLIL
jgi:Flp pilus assembly protein protease CpaA